MCVCVRACVHVCVLGQSQCCESTPFRPTLPIGVVERLSCLEGKVDDLQHKQDSQSTAIEDLQSKQDSQSAAIKQLQIGQDSLSQRCQVRSGGTGTDKYTASWSLSEWEWVGSLY